MSARAPRLVVPEPDPARWAAATELAARAPVPAARGNVVFGTAGWTDKTLVQGGLFYPRGASSAEARLRFYSSQFSLVEVDATYYSLLPPETAERWLDWTPPGFVFDVKAHPIVTGHPVDVARLPGDLPRRSRATGRASTPIACPPRSPPRSKHASVRWLRRSSDPVAWAA